MTYVPYDFPTGQLRADWKRAERCVVVTWDEPSGVYVFRAGAYVKVGWSKNVWLRADQLQNGYGNPTQRPDDVPRRAREIGGVLIAAWPGTYADERAAHKALAEHRAAGEWFHHTPEVDEWIEHRVEQAKERLEARAYSRPADPMAMSAASASRRRSA